MSAYSKESQLKVKKSKKNQPKKSTLKKKAWQSFSRFIRLRDCLATTGTLTHGRCITCNKVFEFDQLQAGHFIPGRGNSILFDEIQVNGQCQGCNLFGRGRYADYFHVMVERYGLERVNQMIEQARQTKKITTKDLEQIIQIYQEKCKQLENKTMKESE